MLAAASATTLGQLKAAIQVHVVKAALIPGLPRLLALLETHLEETDRRLERIERRLDMHPPGTIVSGAPADPMTRL